MRSVLFCNEKLGLGHLRPLLAIAGELVAQGDDSTALVVTGSPAFGGLRVPHGVDVVKLPTPPIDSTSIWGGTSLRAPAGLALRPEEVRAVRSQLSLTIVDQLRPEIVVVDHSPLGHAGELTPALRRLRDDRGCTIALGLWEVDDPESARSSWTPDLLRAVGAIYDLALIYGQSPPHDVRVGGLRRAGVPVHNIGLVAAPPAADGTVDLGEGYLLASTGGGIDGFRLLETLIAAIRFRALGMPAVIVPGPMMPSDQVAELRDSARDLDIRLEEFRPDMESVWAGARAVVAMAGYSTVAEILGSGKPALLVPRAFPWEEQLLRARRLASSGRVAMLEPSELEPTRLRRAIDVLLTRPAAPVTALTGADDAAKILLRDAQTRIGASAPMGAVQTSL